MAKKTQGKNKKSRKSPKKISLFHNKQKESKRLTKYLFDPVYNLKEAAIQLILLEDHLNFTDKLCFDCIMKHIYSYRGFVTEALTLNNGKKYEKVIWPLIEFSRDMERFVSKYKNKPNKIDGKKLSQKIRIVRKPLVSSTFGLCI